MSHAHTLSCTRDRGLVLLVILSVLLLAIASQVSAAPDISGIGDSEPPRSGRVAIEGTGFGTGGRVVIAGLDAWTSTWTDTRVVAYVPEAAPLGPTTLLVIVGGDQSDPVPLTVMSRESRGRIRWTFEADGTNLWWRPALAPDGTIYVHTNNATHGILFALSPDGALLWTRKVGGYPYVPPTAGPDGELYVGSGSTIYRVSKSGQVEWEFDDPDSPGIQVSPTIGPDGRLYGAYDGGIGAFAMNALAGKVIWSNTGEPRMIDKAGEAIEMKFGPAGPGLPSDQMYVSMDGGAGFYAFTLDGKQQFTAGLGNLKGTAEVAIGADGTIHGPRAIGLLVAGLDPVSGSTDWEYHPQDWATGTNNVEIGPDGILYFTGSGAKLEAFDPGDQSRKWQRFEPGESLGRPAVSPDGSVVVAHGQVDGFQPAFVKGFKPRNGRELWTVDLDWAPDPGPRSIGVHHARITPDSATAYMSTSTLGGDPSDPFANLYAIDITSKGGGGKNGGKGGGKGRGKGGKP